MRAGILYAAVFVVVVGFLGLLSWNYLPQPSPHFHFVDLAESFMAGRLDTLTPLRSAGQEPLEGDPAGLQEAVNRARGMDNAGWNDWSSFYEVTLKSGELFKGVWPWKHRKKNQAGYENRDTFVTLHNEWVTFDKNRDVVKACVKTPEGDSEARRAWKVLGRSEDQRLACADEVATNEAVPCSGGTRQRCINERFFVSFPPMPAIAMMPFVAIWHYDFNDVVFTILAGGLAALLLLALLRRLGRQGLSPLGTRDQVILVLLFIFGTVFCFSSIRGQVWFTALILGVVFNLGYLYFATQLRRPLLAGVFLAMGFATRTTLVFASAYFFLQVVLLREPWNRAGLLLRLKKLALFSAPCLLAGIGLMLYNLARFDSPFEFGHKYLMAGTRDSIVDHGLFSFWFLSRNLAAAFANVPQFSLTWPYIKISGHGLSLLATTPVLLYLLWPIRGEGAAEGLVRFRWPLRRIVWVSVGCLAVPGLLYQNTGWLQFGYRFGLDYMPFLFVLLALDRRKRGWLFYSLVGLSIAVNVFGAITFQRWPMFYN